MKRDPKEIAAAIMARVGLPTGYVASSELLAEAEEYVSGLVVGDHITEATDEAALAKFSGVLPMLLRARGLDIDHVEPGVWLIIEREKVRRIYDDEGAQQGDPGFFVKSNRTVRA